MLATAACSKEATGFPPGVDPWDDPATSPSGEWPAWPSTPGTAALTTVTGATPSTGSTPSYYWAHGRVLVAAPIADVWSALQWQSGVLVALYPDYPDVNCEPTHRPEPDYELSYGVKESPNKFGGIGLANWFLVDWRGAAARDGAQAIQKVNVKAQKVDGTTHIALMRQSVVATPGAGGATRLEIVRHINADGESEATARDWVRLWVNALQAQLDGAPLVPAGYCFP